MDNELENRLDDSPKPKRLKTLASSVKFPGGNTFLHQFVLEHSESNNSCAGSYTAGMLLFMAHAPASVVNALDDNGYSALHLAVRMHNLSIVKKLLSCLANVDVDARCNGMDGYQSHGNTALHIAARLGYSSIIHELLNKGASVDRLNSDQQTALCSAALWTQLHAMELLVAKGASVNPASEGDTPLCCAAQAGNLAAVEFLVSNGAAINVGAEGRFTPLGTAISLGNVEIVAFLLANGADKNFRNRFGQTPLHVATSSENVLRIKDVDWHDIEREKNYKALLYKEVIDRDFKSVKLLIEKGADLNATDMSNNTPLHNAVDGGKFECAAFLIDQGADLHAAGRHGWTPLHKAAYKGHVDIVRMLLDRGADVNARTKHGETPIDLAGEKQNQLCIDALQNVG